MMREDAKRTQGKCKTRGVHVWLVLAQAFHALAARAEASLNLSRTGLGDSDFRVLEVLLHKGPLPVNTIGPKVGLTAKGRALITKTFREHAAVMEEAATVLSNEERLMLLRLLKKLGKANEDES